MTAPTLDTLARSTGTFAMIAMDQRESLRAMFDDAGRGRVGDDTLVDFKRDVARELTPYGSAFLVDADFGLRAIVDDRLVAPSCSVIAAADALTQQPGGPVEETALDAVVAADDFDLGGVAAIKLLVIWRRDERRGARVRLARDFIDLARRRGVLSVLEPVVRATPAEEAAGTWDQSEAIREAARELSALGPDLYKVQVPLGGHADHATLLAECRLLDEAIATPWVVLSQGVAIADFPGAVRAACEAGASGFLAGRGLWSDVVGSDDVAARLREVSVPRLVALGEIVDAHGRPWRDAAAAKGTSGPDAGLAAGVSSPVPGTAPDEDPGRSAPVRVGLLHSVPALAGEIEARVRAALPGADVVHLAQADLLTRAVAGDAAVPRMVLDACDALADLRCTAILVTCSSIGEAAEAAGAELSVPVLRIDAPMAAEAVRVAAASESGRVVVVATLSSTLGPSTRLVERAVADAAARVAVETVLVDGAAAARSAGEAESHDRLVRDAVRAAAGRADAVVLAQASMAAAVAGEDLAVPVLTSLDSGVAGLAAAVRVG